MSNQAQLYTDGGSRGNPGPAAIGGVIFSDSSKKTELYSFHEYIGQATNNEAEYQALIHALEWLQAHPKSAVCFLDSKLVVEQVNGNWKIKDARMRQFARRITDIQSQLVSAGYMIEFTHIPRSLNSDADALVNQALDAHLTAE